MSGFRFNIDGEDLKCDMDSKRTQTCIVPKSHFKGKKSGFYFISHKNYLNSQSINYEAPPVKIILSDEGDNSNQNNTFTIILFIVGGIILVALIIIIIICIKKKRTTSSDIDTEKEVGDLGTD